MNEIARIEPARPAPMMAGGKPAAIVPQSMEDCYRLAGAICKAGMAPKGLDTPEKAMVAIMHGLEIGLTPMAALQRIAVVNGRPTIWGDGAMSLVRGSGVCAWIKETLQGAGDDLAAKCESMRKGEPEPIERTFSVADAKKAGLWGKIGPWQQFPTRMLAMRARAFCLRDGFADVLGGLYLREEIEDGEPRRAPPPPQSAVSIDVPPAAVIEHHAADAAPQVRKAPIPPIARKSEPQASAKPSSFDAIRAEFEKRAAAASTVEELGAAWDDVVESEYDRFSPDDQDLLCQINRHRAAEMPGDDGDGDAP